MEQDEKELLEQALERERQAREAFAKRNLGDAARLTQEAARMFSQCGEDYEYVKCLNMLGITYMNMGDEAMGVDCYLEGLEIAQDKKYYDIMSMLYNNIGSRYQELGQHKKAVFYFRKAKETHEKENVDGPRYWENLYVYTLNLAFSYNRLGQTAEVNRYLGELEQIGGHAEARGFLLPVQVLKCNIRWDSGDHEYLAQHLDEMMELCKDLDIESDYLQSIKDFAELLKKTGNYEYWHKLLEMMETVSEQQDTMFFQLTSMEMWMEYYDAIGDKESYGDCCVRHAQLYQMQRENEFRERVQALDMRIDLKKEEERQEAKQEVDALTGIGNRFALNRASRKMVQNANKFDRLVAVGILDVDCFKRVNDAYGRKTGDEYLRRLAKMLQDAVDSYGSVYRFGGDEFVILIDEGDYEAAERVAELIKRKLLNASIPNAQSNVSDILTVSQGYACFRPFEGERLSGLLEHADKVLDKVKENGKNDYRILLEEL